jgi:hypothetical protein
MSSKAFPIQGRPEGKKGEGRDVSLWADVGDHQGLCTPTQRVPKNTGEFRVPGEEKRREEEITRGFNLFLPIIIII